MPGILTILGVSCHRCRSRSLLGGGPDRAADADGGRGCGGAVDGTAWGARNVACRSAIRVSAAVGHPPICRERALPLVRTADCAVGVAVSPASHRRAFVPPVATAPGIPPRPAPVASGSGLAGTGGARRLPSTTCRCPLGKPGDRTTAASSSQTVDQTGQTPKPSCVCYCGRDARRDCGTVRRLAKAHCGVLLTWMNRGTPFESAS